MKEYAPKHRNVGETDLYLNENPFPPPNKILDFSNINVNNYQPLSAELLSKLAGYTGVDAHTLFISNGCDALLHLTCDALLEKDDNVIVLSPFFHRTEYHILKLTKNLIIIPQKEDYSYNLEELLNYKAAKAVFFANPNNPTGLMLRDDEIIRIVEGLSSSVIVIDEALMNYDEKNSFELVKKYSNVVILRSFSKNFGLAGMRIGFGCSCEGLTERIKEHISPFEVNYLSQIAASRILDEKEYLNHYVNNMNKGLEYIKKELKALGLTYTDSVSSNILINIKNVGKTSKEVFDFLKNKCINVVDASSYFVCLNSDYLIRVSISSEENNKRLISAIKDLKNR